MYKRLKRKSPEEVALYWFVSFIFLIVAASYLYILIWAIIAGAKTHSEVALDPFGLPDKWNFNNYLEVFRLLNVNGNNFFDMLFNSVYFSVVCVGVQQLTSINLAYCATKYTFPGSKLIYPIILIVITLPLYGTSGATYNLLKSLGLIDSYAQVLTSMSGFNTLFLYYAAYFKNLSWTYAEAAKMDGANHFQVYYRVMLPQAKPILGALFLTQWVSTWNSYESALVYLPNHPTLPVGIYQFNTEMIYRARLDILFAACVIISIPAIVLFIAFNKVITTNISVGGLKG